MNSLMCLHQFPDIAVDREEILKVRSVRREIKDGTTTFLFPILKYGDYVSKFCLMMPKDTGIVNVFVRFGEKILDSYGAEILALDSSNDVIAGNSLYHNLKFWFQNNGIPLVHYEHKYISLTVNGEYTNKALFAMYYTNKFVKYGDVDTSEKQIYQHFYKCYNARLTDNGVSFSLYDIPTLPKQKFIIKTDAPLALTDRITICHDDKIGTSWDVHYLVANSYTTDCMHFTLPFHIGIKNPIITINNSIVTKLQVYVQYYNIAQFADGMINLKYQPDHWVIEHDQSVINKLNGNADASLCTIL